ncbi:MAG: hypothetical protein JWR50_700 [Mucilaginibacter sp.]|nr:hypothetical protein [Mucilaginibacter sp.]
MTTLIMHPQNKEQLNALKAVAKALKISVETSPYDPEFVAMVKKAEKNGNYTEVDPNDSATKAVVYKKKLAKTSVWSDDDLKFLEDGKNAFENFKPQQW